jgi:hypothetical protein
MMKIQFIYEWTSRRFDPGVDARKSSKKSLIMLNSKILQQRELQISAFVLVLRMLEGSRDFASHLRRKPINIRFIE